MHTIKNKPCKSVKSYKIPVQASAHLRKSEPGFYTMMLITLIIINNAYYKKTSRANQ